MAEAQKPQPDIVTVAARAMTHPHLVTREDITRMAARILDDERSDRVPNKRRLARVLYDHEPSRSAAGRLRG